MIVNISRNDEVRFKIPEISAPFQLLIGGTGGDTPKSPVWGCAARVTTSLDVLIRRNLTICV